MTDTERLAKLDADIFTTSEILDTYEGMASMYDGEGEYPAHVFDKIDDLRSELAALEAAYNAVLIAIETEDDAQRISAHSTRKSNPERAQMLRTIAGHVNSMVIVSSRH